MALYSQAAGKSRKGCAIKVPDKMHEKFIHMTETPVRRLIPELAVPTIISMLVTAFYNMADTFFVGRINTQATAAVGVVFSFMAILQACGFFFGHGSGNYISRQLGAENVEEASRMAANGFFFALATGVAVAAVGMCFLEPLSRVLGSTETILPYTCDYLRIILLGAPFIMASFVMNNQLRYQGSASYAMVGIVTGAALNIALDPFLIFYCGMGIAGAAAATVISQIVSFFILLKMCASGSNLRLSPKNFHPRPADILEIIRGGFPSLCRQGLASVATIALNRAAGGYGDAVIAGMSIVSRVTMFANSVMIGWGQGFQPVCGFNFGAKRYGRVLEAYYFCLKVAFVFLTVMAVVMFAVSDPIMRMFRREDAEVIRIGALALKLQCVLLPVQSFTIIGNMLTQSIGYSFRATLTAIGKQGLFFIPAILVLPGIFGVLGLQLAQPVADLLTFILTQVIVVMVVKELKGMDRKGTDG